MEAVNGWFSLSMLENFSGQDNIAIRQFCPARVKEEQGAVSAGETMEALDEMVGLRWSPTHDTKSNPDDLRFAPSEEEEIVDTFFNLDCFDKHNQNLVEGHHGELAFAPDDHFQFQHLEELSMTNYDIFGDDHLMLFEGDELDLDLDLDDDHGVVSEIVPRPEEVSASHGVDQGLHLVHLLLACAEAVGCRDTQLADSILSQIWPAVRPWGDSVLRVSYCFAMGLNSRLSLLQNVNANGTLFTNATAETSSFSREDKIEAFRLLHKATPYISFGFMAANDAICQAAKGKDLLHIVDVGSIHHLQWPSLVRNLSSRTEGPPKVVRITIIIEDQYSFTDLESNMKAVVDEASSLGICFAFHIITGPATPQLLTKENLELREGEVLFVNSIMHLHKFVKESRGSLKAILQAIKRLGPALLTVVEQDANHNGPFFLGRFLESLHYYSAIFDSLEVSLPRDSPQRMKIEKFHFAEEIRNIVAYEGSDRIERHERADQWRRQLGRAGFQSVGLKSISQVRMMLSVYGCDGYTLASEKGCLLLGWKGRPIMLASAWQVHNVPS